MNTDFFGNIEEKLPALSRGQKKIAQYILKSYDKAAFLTANALGRTVQVSESTVVRFAYELGYDGYPQMQEALQEVVLSRLTSVQRMDMAQEQMVQEDVFGTVLQGDIERLRLSGEALDRKAFDGAVDALVAARRIYVLGVRSSAPLATFFAYYLNYLFDDVRLITSASQSEAFERIARIGREDVLFGISFPRYSTTALQAMGYANRAGARIIALSDSPASPLADFAEFFLEARSDMVSLVDSLVAPMSVINAILVALAAKKREETARNLDRLEEIWDTYHVYEKIGE